MCNTYVLASYVHRRDSNKTYASCWLSRVAVGSLGYIPSPPGPQTGRYIAKIAAGGNQGNRMRNSKVLSEIIKSASVARSGRPSKRNGPCNGTERYWPWNRTERFTPFLGKRCCRATQTERTVFRTFFDAYRIGRLRLEAGSKRSRKEIEARTSIRGNTDLVAQLVEHLPRKQYVVGLNHTWAALFLHFPWEKRCSG